MDSDTLHRIEADMMAAIEDALAAATGRAAACQPQDMARSPSYGYFMATAHQKLFARLCGAHPDTFEGGNAATADAIIDNARNIRDHYWAKAPGDGPHIRASTDEGG